MQESIRYLKGIGPQKEKLFNKLGVYTLEDLLYYFPVRYEDRTNVKRIKDIQAGEPVVVRGKVLIRELKYVRGGKNIFEVLLRDDTGKVRLTWFNQPYLKDAIQCNDELFVYGKPELYRSHVQFVCPVYEKITDGDEDTSYQIGKIIPVYGLTNGLTQNVIRKAIVSLLPEVAAMKLLEPLQPGIRAELSFPAIQEGLTQMHYPSRMPEAERARLRFIFEELFTAQILVYVRKARVKQAEGIAFQSHGSLIDSLKQAFPFTLTQSQERVLEEIFKDMASPSPMHRLLQGDVGSGKTIIAALAMALCAANHYQAALMVPTEVLALQHGSTLAALFKKLPFKLEVLLGSTPAKKKEEIHAQLADGSIDLIVGTHALIQETVMFKQLGLVIIDEQHRFGVAQRILLPKKGRHPDILVMSATPIPRSLALTLYGDLDISVIDRLPGNRKTPQSTLITDEKRDWLYQFITERIQDGRQVYIVYPLIEDSKSSEMRAAESMYAELKKSIFKSYSVGLLHGRLNAEQKFRVLRQFQQNAIQILVSTTVIEVGIDVPNANCMIVEHPDRFGLSQLHQLRGRVCRSVHQPYFIMVAGNGLPEDVTQRLSVIVNTSDGFKIAEEDLKLRGPGDFFGNFQHGYPENRIAHPLRDLKILQQARQYAYHLVKQDPTLKSPENQAVKEYIKRKFFKDKTNAK